MPHKKPPPNSVTNHKHFFLICVSWVNQDSQNSVWFWQKMSGTGTSLWDPKLEKWEERLWWMWSAPLVFSGKACLPPLVLPHDLPSAVLKTQLGTHQERESSKHLGGSVGLLRI